MTYSHRMRQQSAATRARWFVNVIHKLKKPSLVNRHLNILCILLNWYSCHILFAKLYRNACHSSLSRWVYGLNTFVRSTSLAWSLVLTESPVFEATIWSPSGVNPWLWSRMKLCKVQQTCTIETWCLNSYCEVVCKIANHPFNNPNALLMTFRACECRLLNNFFALSGASPWWSFKWYRTPR